MVPQRRLDIRNSDVFVKLNSVAAAATMTEALGQENGKCMKGAVRERQRSYSRMREDGGNRS